MQDFSTAFNRLSNIVKKLRAADGCPWDKTQSPDSLKRYLLEETLEVLDAIDNSDPEHVREELGDLLYIIVLLGHIYEENGFFTMNEIFTGISDKMIHRHPHVFAREPTGSKKILKEKWLAAKKLEKTNKTDKAGKKTPFATIPKSLPTLSRAQMVLLQASLTGFDWPGVDDALNKLDEEIAEMKEAVDAGDKQALSEEIGDVLLAAVNIGRMSGVNTEQAMTAATAKFIERFSRLEDMLGPEKSLAEMDSESLLSLWRQSKQKT